MVKRIAAAFLAALLSMSQAAFAQNTLFLTTTGVADAPRGFVALCHDDQQLCRALGGMPGQPGGGVAGSTLQTASIARANSHAAPEPAIVSANVDPARLLTQINRLVNGHVRQRTDRAQFGQGELWRRSGIGRDAVGDCEDLAIEKRLQLIEAGYPADRLFFAVVYRRDLGLHTLLLARTDAGDMVLDSRSPYVRPWQDTGYDWISAQVPGEAGQWQMVVAPRRG